MSTFGPHVDKGGGPEAQPWHARALSAFAAAVMFAMMSFVFTDVVGRYVFNAPIPGGSEYIAFMLGILVFSGFAVVTRNQAHITVGIFDGLFRGRVRWIRNLVIALANCVAVAFVTERLWQEAEFMRDVQQIGEFLDIEVAPIYYALAVLGMFAFLYTVGSAWTHIRRSPGAGRQD